MNPPDRLVLIDSTLREGEQHAAARFSTSQRLQIADLLDAFGIDYLECTSPAASPQSARDLELIAARGLHARVATHIRCSLHDARLAVECGVQAVHLLYATSATLRNAGHRRDAAAIVADAAEVISYLQQHGVEIRFSAEDSFRSDPTELLQIYRAVADLGIARVGIADTVGIAAPRDVTRLVRSVRRAVPCAIEFHGHNDTGCAVANTFSAFEAGASHLDVTILGIGERNGIAALSDVVARFAASPYHAQLSRYRLDLLPQLDAAVAALLGTVIPHNSCISSPTAFHHKAGLHTHAVLNDPRSYEVLDPAIFGRQRTVAVAHRLVGRHAVTARARELGVALDEAQARAATARIKSLADHAPLDPAAVDAIVREYALNRVGMP
jgi:homocitrate synthase